MLGLLGALDPHKHKVQKGRSLRNTMGMPISKPMDKNSKAIGIVSHVDFSSSYSNYFVLYSNWDSITFHVTVKNMLVTCD